MAHSLEPDIHVLTITIRKIVEYKKLSSGLPPGFARLKRYKDTSGLTLKDIIKAKHDKQIDIVTLRGYLQVAESLLVSVPVVATWTKNLPKV